MIRAVSGKGWRALSRTLLVVLLVVWSGSVNAAWAQGQTPPTETRTEGSTEGAGGGAVVPATGTVLGSDAQLALRFRGVPAYRSESLEGRLTLFFSEALAFDLTAARRLLQPDFIRDFVVSREGETGTRLQLVLAPTVAATPTTAEGGRSLLVNLTSRSRAASPSASILPDLIPPSPTSPANEGTRVPPASGEATRVPLASSEGVRVPPASGEGTRVPQTLSVRAGIHPNFGRLVLDFPSPTNYQVVRTGPAGQLHIQLSRPHNADLSRAARVLRTYLAPPAPSLSAGQLRATMRPGITLRHAAYDNKLVLDFVASSPEIQPETQSATQPENAGARPASPSPPPEPSPVSPSGLETVAVRSGQTQDHTRLVFDWARPVNFIITQEQGLGLRVIFNQPARLDFSALSFGALQGYGPPSQTNFQDNTHFLLPVPEGAQYRYFRAGDKVLLDLLHTPSARARIRPPAGAPRPADRSDFALEAPAPAPPGALFELDLILPERTSLAAFERGPCQWLVYSRELRLVIERMLTTPPPLFTDILQLEDNQNSLFCFKTRQPVYPHLALTALRWTYRLYPEPPELPESEPVFSVQKNRQFEDILLLSQIESGAHASLRDPHFGDNLFVIMTLEPLQGIRKKRVFPEFEILETTQGVVIKSFAETIELEQLRQDFVLSRPGGLSLSAAMPRESSVLSQSLRKDPIFEIVGWAWPDQHYLEVEGFFHRRLANRDTQRDLEEIELAYAGYHVLNLFAYEALGILEVMRQNNPDMTDDLRWRLLYAAANILAERPEPAEDILEDSDLLLYQEGQLWNAALHAIGKDWELANLYFERSEDVLNRYPPRLQARLGLLRIESALRQNRHALARIWERHLNALRFNLDFDVATGLLFYLGWIEELNGESQQAVAHYTRVEADTDTLWEARARIRRIAYERELETLDYPAALALLEASKSQWEGDRIELQHLTLLGRLYLDSKAYEKGLSVFRDTLIKYPGVPEAQELAQSMLEAFQEAFLGENAQDLGPEEAYALYEEFQELTPAGQDGNRLIESLADRLSAIGAYDIAAELLDQQLQRRLQGESRARTALKVALLYILDGQYERARQRADAASRVLFDVNAQIARDARLLDAYGLHRLGRTDAALTRLAGDVSRSADLLRLEINWEAQDYREAARVLQRLAGEPPDSPNTPLDETNKWTLVYWAIALYLEDDTEALNILRRRYRPWLGDSPLDRTFLFITGNEVENPELLLSEILEQQRQPSFLDALRGRYMVAPSGPAGAAST